MKTPIVKIVIALSLLLAVLWLAGCSSSSKTPLNELTVNATDLPAAATTKPTDTPIPPTDTPLPTTTFTETPTEMPTDTPIEPPSPTVTATPTTTPTSGPVAVPEEAIYIFFAQASGGDAQDCNRTVIPAYSGFVRTGDLRKDVTTALNRLFAVGVKNVGSLYNPLYQSRLTVSQIDYNQSKPSLTVYMTGAFVKPKNGCDQLRYRDQVWATVRQFGVRNVIVLANNKLMGDLLAAKDR
jgi:hypothetical protein